MNSYPKTLQSTIPAQLAKGISELSLVIGMMFLIPYAIHLIPSWDDSPIGGKLLPIFYAPLFAALTRHWPISILASLLAPWLNYMIIGAPPPPVATLLTVHLVPFAAIAWFLSRKTEMRITVGPVAYLVSKPFTLLAFLIFPSSFEGMSIVSHFVGTTINALPGLVILALIGYLSKISPGPGAHA